MLTKKQKELLSFLEERISQSGVTTGVGGVGRIRFDFTTLNGYNYGSSDALNALNDASNPDAGYSESYD